MIKAIIFVAIFGLARAQICQNGYARLDSSTSKCFKYYAKPQPAESAQGDCTNFGNLASIGNAFENHAIFEFVNSFVNSPNASSFYIGLMRNGSNWAWIDNSNSSYRNWAPGYPGSYNCTSYDIGSGKWYTTECGTALSYLCGADSSSC